MVAFRSLSDEEYKIELEKKLDEEVAEFHESKSLEELTDIYDVLIALIVVGGYTCKDFMRVCKSKNKERGGFGKRIFLEEVEDD